MRTIGQIAGVLAFLAGTVWTLQGIGVLPGSFMSSDPTWAVIGVVTAAIGLALVVWIRRRPSAES